MLTRYVRPPLACANIGVILMGIGALALTVNLGLTAYAAEPLVERIDQLEAKSFSQEKAARILEEEGLVPIWDRLNAATPTGRFDVFTNIGIEFLTLGREAARQTYDHDIEEVKFFEGGQRIDAAAWGQLLQGLKMQGYEITHSDWHQERYETNKDGSPVSDTRFTIQGRRNGGQDRMEVKATARITWRKAGGTFFPARVEVMDGKIRRRSAPPAFAQRLRLNLAAQDAPPQLFENSDDGSFCAYDLNGDQLPEIIMASHDKILWNRGNWKFELGKILTGESNSITPRVSLVADLNGDGIPDWVCDNGDHLEMHAGLKNPTLAGAFAAEATVIPMGSRPLKMVTAITAGDVNHDGHLDLFVAQYRQPYESMPKKFWDANDGYGNTLLINDGKGHFTDQTEAARLGAKRFRRTYAASLVDLNGDGNLDLVVVSDFCGTDVYLGDGHGKFTDATDKMLDAPHTFGMSHTIADYNHDGRLDLFVTGMSSTTARRLERMGAFPEGFEEANRMRTVMGYGNRMYLARPEGGFAEPEFKDAVARTGWSWGSTSFDFDNDGYEDIYVGNGHITGKTTSDYCTRFWCRDIYVLPGVENAQLQSYLGSIPNRRDMSWDGYQVKSLLVNQGGHGFQDFSYMLDVGFDYDSRQVVAADLDLDGKVDLIVSRQPEFGPTGTAKDSRPTSIVLYQNVLEVAAKRDWIGVSLTGSAAVSPLGAIIAVETAKGVRRATVISGDSFLCQHPAQKHFGIEAGNAVKGITVLWPDGSKTVKRDPELKQYHVLSPPARPGL